MLQVGYWPTARDHTIVCIRVICSSMWSSSVQGAWRQTAHWHVHGCVGKAVSRRRFTQSSVVNGASGNPRGVRCRVHSPKTPSLWARGRAYTLLGWPSLSLSGAWRQTAHWHVQGCVGRAVSPRRQVTQKPLRRKTRHASITGRAPVWHTGVAERPGHSHAHVAEA